MKKLVTLVGLAMLALTACGGSDSPEGQPSPTKASESRTEAPSATVSTRPTPSASKTAGQLAELVDAKLSQVTSVKVWTEDNDPNKLLGRPNQYTSAATLIDKRLGDCSDPGIDCGATIEVFATEAQAKQRSDYIQSLRTGGALGTEYNTIEGPVLMRVTGELPPKANREYAAQLREALKS